MKQSIRILLDTLIDYAGTFPPASLPLDEAVRKYDEYRNGAYAWALGRFVVKAADVAKVPVDFPLSVVAGYDAIPETYVVEVKADSAEEIDVIHQQMSKQMIYVETNDLDMIEILGHYGMRAKIRTGGVTAGAFPTVEHVATFIRECRQREVAFKATAGLHHPIRCASPITYESDAPVATMHGFVNVFMAAALPGSATLILREENARAFGFDDGGIWYRDLRITTEELTRVRQHYAVSFGSCAFEEPIGELQELGWL
ncbi:MAG TPA: hypothetical protein VLU46_05390 [Thermoanaerobaculia bacterium]|nr:hypothetical protein [Thermoanaerobaculia bacterium]